MSFKNLSLDSLVVNRANDRHGELENETAAIAWLFNKGELHMRNLAKDIAQQCQVYDAPLVFPEGEKFIVFDGNRRVTCLKLLQNPRRAPTIELQSYFEQLQTQCADKLSQVLECQIENDRDRIDDILFRRHTGSQAGVGQSNWDDRMKSNFVNRTGMGGGVNVASEIEKQLAKSSQPEIKKKIPWSTINRLLSAEPFRNRVGFTFAKGKFEFTHQAPVVLAALHRIAEDLANKRTVLNDVWDVDGKRAYLDQLGKEGILPKVEHTLVKPLPPPTKSSPRRTTAARSTTATYWLNPGCAVSNCMVWPPATSSRYLGRAAIPVATNRASKCNFGPISGAIGVICRQLHHADIAQNNQAK